MFYFITNQNVKYIFSHPALIHKIDLELLFY